MIPLHEFALRSRPTTALHDTGSRPRCTSPPHETALPGTAVAYLFAPHGLVFHKSPVITQDLRGTEVFGDPLRLGELEGAYFPEVSALAGLTAIIRETRPTQVDVTSISESISSS